MKLQAFLACDKVLESPGTGPSLITTFQKLISSLPAGAEIPKNAAIPRDWAVFSVWSLDESEHNQPYNQILELYWPDGTLFITADLTSKPEAADQFLTFISRFNGFPIGQSGKVKMRLRIEAEGKTIGGPAESWLMVEHKTLAAEGMPQ